MTVSVLLCCKDQTSSSAASVLVPCAHTSSWVSDGGCSRSSPLRAP